MEVTEKMLRSEDKKEVTEAMAKCQRKFDEVCEGNSCKNGGRCFNTPFSNILRDYKDSFKKLAFKFDDFAGIFDKRIDALEATIHTIRELAETHNRIFTKAANAYEHQGKQIEALDNQILDLKEDVSDLENEVTKLNQFLVL